MARRSTSMLLGGSALLLMTSTASSASSSGLTMRVYNNSAWYGQPIQSSVVDGFDQQVPVHPGGSAFSVELVGTLTYPQAKPCFENDKGVQVRLSLCRSLSLSLMGASLLSVCLCLCIPQLFHRNGEWQLGAVTPQHGAIARAPTPLNQSLFLATLISQSRHTETVSPGQVSSPDGTLPTGRSSWVVWEPLRKVMSVHSVDIQLLEACEAA